MGITLEEIAGIVSGELRGPGDLEFKGIQALDRASSDELTFAVGPKYALAVRQTGAGAIILPRDWPGEIEKPAVLVDDPYLAYALVASAFSRQEMVYLGVSPEAHVGQGCEIPEDVTVAPGVFIDDEVKLGPGCVVHPGAFLGKGVSLGRDCTIYPNVTVYHGCRLGNRVIVHAGAVIGSDGFGYAQHEGRHVKIPQTGIVVVEDEVEIGANTTIDRAALGETRIGAGCKIDNLVQIGHNVHLGPGCVVVAQVGIAGSTRVGAGVMIGGQAGIAGHLSIGDMAKIGAQSGVMKKVSSGDVVIGSPAMSHRLFMKVSAILRRLPNMKKELDELREKVKALGA